MENSENQICVVKIATALSDKPFFVRISNELSTIEQISTQAIVNLRENGKTFEATQLEDLFKAHQIFNNGKVVQKGDLFTELDSRLHVVNNQAIKMAEIDLISSHSGGMIITEKCTYVIAKECKACENCSRFIGCLRSEVAHSKILSNTRKAHLLNKCLIDL